MVTPFEVYLVMQLDALRGFLCWISAIGAIVALIATIVGFFAHMDNEEWAFPFFLAGRKWFIAALCGLFVGIALPSTKTAAAMILLPALTSKEVTEPLSREAGELYELAKSALRNAANKPESNPEPKE